PPECPLFRSACTPVSPAGPCMVSGEGTCGAYFRYFKGDKS
ncbi:MAG: hydrogenase expression/formation protein HypD, partial [Synergistaceae bacterium]|nr:hydrogenase expression/formation protein HypD [Synergistaceae bacterium]